MCCSPDHNRKKSEIIYHLERSEVSESVKNDDVPATANSVYSVSKHYSKAASKKAVAVPRNKSQQRNKGEKIGPSD